MCCSGIFIVVVLVLVLHVLLLLFRLVGGGIFRVSEVIVGVAIVAFQSFLAGLVEVTHRSLLPVLFGDMEPAAGAAVLALSGVEIDQASFLLHFAVGI